MRNARIGSFNIEQFQMKNGYLKELEISKQLNFNGYRTEKGFSVLKLHFLFL